MNKFLNFRRSALMLVSALILWCCESDSLVPQLDEESAVAFEASYAASLEETSTVAKNFWNSDSTNNTGRAARIFEVEDATVFTDSDRQPLLHAYNYREGGFIIVSADKRMMPVLAYASDGESVDWSRAEEINGLKVWINDTKNQIKALGEEDGEVNRNITKEWDRYLGTSSVSSNNGREAANTNCQEWYTIGQYMCQYSSTTRGPLLSYHTVNGNGYKG